ncbi:MAG: ferric reductase-like transmembrane domain-containing protein [Vicinamibacterales bacterium]
MNKKPAIQSSIQPLGIGSDLRRRVLFHHMPIAAASALVLVLFMTLPILRAQSLGDIFSGALPRERGEGAPMDHRDGHTMDRGGHQSEPPQHGVGQGGQVDPGAHAGRMGHGGATAGATDRGERQHGPFVRQLTFATGYVALGLLGLTLLIGPANLLLNKRTPVSNYLSRDVGMWAAIVSVVHTILALQVHGSGRLRDFAHFFVGPDGSPLLNSFGLGNWTGLAALVIVLGLLAISSDAALRRLKAKRWKRLQRLNYALFVLVILHAFFYGALLRITSPTAFLLTLSVIAVCIGQGVGIGLWRRRDTGIERPLS